MTRKYELVYVVSPDAADAQVADLHTQVEAIVQRIGGQIEKTDNWGRRKLAYEIGPHKEATYVLEVINERFLQYIPARFDKYLDTTKFGPGLGSRIRDELHSPVTFGKSTGGNTTACAACHLFPTLQT